MCLPLRTSTPESHHLSAKEHRSVTLKGAALQMLDIHPFLILHFQPEPDHPRRRLRPYRCEKMAPLAQWAGPVHCVLSLSVDGEGDVLARQGGAVRELHAGAEGEGPRELVGTDGVA